MSMLDRTETQYRTDQEGDFFRLDPPLPKNMMVELSNGCNHACVFCPNPHMQRKKWRIGRGLLFRAMEEAYAGGTREIGFYTTGDPFIHKDLAAFTKVAKDLGFTYTYISTNGALASPERSRVLIDAGIDSIKFSINAGSRETYEEIHGKDDWDAVVANLTYISEYRRDHAPNLKLYITCVVTRTIEREVDGIQEMFGPLVDEISFDPCTPLAWPDAALSDDPGICNMPFNRLHLTFEGYLTLCCVDFQNYLAVADLNTMSLSEAWHAPAFQDIRRRHLEKNLSGTLCGRCWRGDRAAVKPLNEDYADELDHDAYEKTQRDHVMNHLRVEKAAD